MATQSLVKRVETLEEQMTELGKLAAAVAENSSQISQLRTEMRTEFSTRSEMVGEFSAVRSEMAAEFAAVRAEMATRTEMQAEFAAVRAEMRVLHEDVVARIALLHEGLNGRRPAPKPRKRKR